MRAPHLTRRQWDVIHLLVQGLTTGQIADRLSIAPGTVRHHREHILRAFDVTTTVEVARWYGRYVDAH